ncbi:MAG: hypothetical protein IRZ16_15875 [Myxococcaceae bacterium]|nr:hypothetical protein [Myxococcaceae bacterium]
MVFGALLGLMISVSPPTAGSRSWDFLDERPVRPQRVRRPTAFLFDRAIEEMQAALGHWERERREFNHDAADLDRIRAHRQAAAETAPNSDELLSGDAEEPAAPVTDAPPDDRVAGAARKPEETPADASEPAVEEDDPVAAQIRRLDVELTERQRLCAADPVACAKERELRNMVREGNRAWDEAIKEKERARQEAIEAEARKIQAELDAARRREAQERAKRMGGAIDASGNFVDEDLHRELDQEAARAKE